jgi:hypothetical protein
MINLDYPNLLDLFKEHIDPNRTESASFLIWFLQNYYRLDPLEAVDSVCDKKGDKGVDGIYVNDNDMTITIFQAKISQTTDSSIGDSFLKEFYGTLSQFKNQESIKNLIDTGGDAEVVRLVERLDVINKIKTHDLNGIFISNIDIDSNGEAYLRNIQEIQFIGKSILIKSYISDKRTSPVTKMAEFDISGLHTSEYIVDKNTKAVIAPTKAQDLVQLDGISDQSLFAFNVRGPLGKTQVNKDIIKSIKDPSTHKLFPLFHNGITIICGELENDKNKIRINNYYVVNGCQSLDSLYENSNALTDNLRILTKFIKMDINSVLSEQVTRYSNNQNGVKPRDFQANNPIQIRLQNDFFDHYEGEYFFEIKRGEVPKEGALISNETAGLLLMSFDLKEPWSTHRKYQIFDEKHADVFARPEVSADRIVLCYVIMEIIDELSDKIENRLFAKYSLTKRAILYMIRSIIEKDQKATEILTKPRIFVRDKKDRSHFRECIKKVVSDVVIDINAEVREYGEDFDYRGKLRDSKWVKDLCDNVVNNFLKLVERGRIPSFSDEWNNKKTI